MERDVVDDVLEMSEINCWDVYAGYSTPTDSTLLMMMIAVNKFYFSLRVWELALVDPESRTPHAKRCEH